MAVWHAIDDAPIWIDARGVWRQGDTPLHPKVAKLFAANLHVAACGGYEIRLCGQHAAVEVMETPFFIRRLDGLPAAEDVPIELSALRVAVTFPSSSHITSKKDCSEPWDLTTLMVGGDDALYGRVLRAGYWMPARFLPEPYHALAQRLVPDVPEAPKDASLALHTDAGWVFARAYNSRPLPALLQAETTSKPEAGLAEAEAEAEAGVKAE